MLRIAEFEKVSFARFAADWQAAFPAAGAAEAERLYAEIKLPQRATSGSAGYDFFTPVEICIKPKENILLPSGVRVRMAEGWFLAIMPKSGLGFKYRLQMDNTVGIIDSDYYYSDNEGHIFVKITNDGNHGKIITLSPGAAVCQGLFLPFGITESDAATARRNGGLGSTAK